MKVTPMELCREPMRLEMGEGHYDLSSQRRIGTDPLMAMTAQTYNSQGKPMDSRRDVG